jgi:peptidoglycan/LPS O-acetylase OafA/YrhL
MQHPARVHELVILLAVGVVVAFAPFNNVHRRAGLIAATVYVAFVVVISLGQSLVAGTLGDGSTWVRLGGLLLVPVGAAIAHTGTGRPRARTN